MNLKSAEFLFLPGVIAFATTVLLLVVRAILLRAIKKRSTNTLRHLDATLNDVFRFPSLYFCLAIGLYVGIELTEMPPKLNHNFHLVLKSVIILTVTVALANSMVLIYRRMVQRSGSPLPTSGLVIVIIRTSVFIIGVLIILSILNVSVAPILTALGVGGLAVALALKDTLENFFAGIHLLTDRAVTAGDFVRLENNQEGQIEEIGWRTTKVKLRENNLLIIPNSKLSQSILTNFSAPDRRILCSVVFPLPLTVEPQQVEDTLLEICRKGTEDISGLLGSPPPMARFHPGPTKETFDFTLLYYVASYSDQYFVRHELRKRAVEALRAKKIAYLK